MLIKLVDSGGNTIKEPFQWGGIPAQGEVFRIKNDGEYSVVSSPAVHDVEDDKTGRTTAMTSVTVQKLSPRNDGAVTAHGKRTLKE